MFYAPQQEIVELSAILHPHGTLPSLLFQTIPCVCMQPLGWVLRGPPRGAACHCTATGWIVDARPCIAQVLCSSSPAVQAILGTTKGMKCALMFIVGGLGQEDMSMCENLLRMLVQVPTDTDALRNGGLQRCVAARCCV